MSDVPIKVIVDCSTGETEVRPYNAEELIQLEADIQAMAEQESLRKAEENAKAEAKASAEAKLSALGLTPAEIAALR